MTVVSDVERGTAPGPDPEPSPSGSGDVRHALVRLAHRAPAAVAALVSLVGLLVLVSGYAAGWSGDTDLAIVLYYLGLVVVLAPYATLLLSARPDRRSRIVGVVCFGLTMYAAWMLASPVYSTAFDESLHVTTLADMTGGAGWFAENTMLPVSPHYPGLELAATAVHWLTGLPLMACQVIVVVTARVALVLGLYLVGARLTRTARGGGLVVLLYAASPQFYFFNAMFSYQTVALALLIGAVVFQLRAFDVPEGVEPFARGGAGRALVGVQLCVAALVLTHHLTSWLTVAAFWLLALVLAAFGDQRRAKLAVVSAQVGLLLVVAWSAVIAPLLARYLGPVAEQAGTELVRLIRLDGGQREVLAENPDNAAPGWETAVMAASVIMWVALLLPALRAALLGRTLGRSPVRFILVVLAAAFPTLFVVRISPAAAEIADRASTFVTLAVVLVVVGWLMSTLRSGERVVDRLGLAASVPAVLVLLVGGLILGSGPDWQRTPGPYLAGAEQRSVDGETLAVGEWAGRYLPEGSRFAADNTFGRVLPTLAPVDPVTSSSGSVDVTPLFVNETLDLEARQLIVRGRVDFVVVDRRWVGETVRSGSFAEGSEGYGERARTLTEAQLGKFEDAAGFRLVLDGPVQVYDVRSLRDEPQTFVDRGEPGLPGDASPLRSALALMFLALLGAALLTRRRRGGWSRPDALPVFLALPTLVAVGALGVSTGLPTWLGVALGVLVAAGAVVALRRYSEHHDGWTRRLPVAIPAALLVTVIVVLATPRAYDAQFDVPPLPAPPTAGAMS